jgi:uncharacterized protein YbjT (DUF2867 family)
MTAPIRSVPVTGPSGNLGQKLIAGLLRQEGCEHIVALDRTLPATSSDDLAKVRWVEGDVAMPTGTSLRDAMAGVDAVDGNSST